MAEFSKDKAMLDKFRCDEIVHFDGGCLIPNHVMLVTEFAPCGSLADCIKKKDEPSDDNMKAKLMLDAVKGLEYLHSNGIIHCDIKQDNVHVFSLDEMPEVKGKQTDFGRSRKREHAGDEHEVYEGDRDADAHGAGGAEQEVQE